MDRTVRDLVEHYKKMVVERCDNPHRVMNLKRYCRFFIRDIGSIKLVDLKRATLHECRERLLLEIAKNAKKKGSNCHSTANRYFQTFHRMLSLADVVWGWEEAAGLPKLPKLREPRPRTDFLSREQRIALLEACKESLNTNLYLIVCIAIGTGIRKGEIQKLKWSLIDCDSGVAIIPETKNGEPLRIKFGGFVLNLIREYRERCDRRVDLLFPSSDDPSKPTNWQTSWENAHKRAGLPKSFVFHSLRHSFASDLAAAGAQLLDIATLLNHKSINTTKRYAHLTREHTDQLVESINKRQFG